MRSRLPTPAAHVTVVAALLLAVGCNDSSDRASVTSAPAAAVTTTALEPAAQVRSGLGALHRSTIAEIPNLVALFYHHPDGWAVEDVSLDKGTTWCRHAWYRWEITEAIASDDFTVTYTASKENPDCAPSGRPLVLHVTSRTTRDGRTVLSGEYVAIGLHAERTVCPGTIADWQDVCGESSELGPPTAEAPTAP